MRRFPRVRALVTGFAAIALVSAVLAGGTTPAYAAAGGITVPPNTVANPNNHNGTYTFSYPKRIAVVPEAGDEPETPACTAAGATTGPVGLTSSTFNEGTTTVTCTTTAPPDGPPEVIDTGTFTVKVNDEKTVLTNPSGQPPANQTVASTGATDNAFVSYPTVTASEMPSGEQEISPTCTADNGATSTDTAPFTSSGTFNVGLTTVTCDATDGDGTTPPGPTATEITFTVTVADQPVTMTVPGTQLAQATSSSGATVSYGPVTEAENGEAETISPTCSADKGAATSADGFISGGNFPLGGTTISCAPADSVDGTGTPTAIDTTPSWNGSQSIKSFGYPDTATYGQTVTVPATDTVLSSFTFYMKLPTALLFRGEVYAWDNTANQATGPALYESAQTSTTDPKKFQAITFTPPGGISLTAGAHYVLFVSVSTDFLVEPPGLPLTGPAGAIATDAYPDGAFFYLNNRGDTSQWFGPWNSCTPCSGARPPFVSDLAFNASFSPPQSFTVIVTKTPCAALAGCNLHGLDLTNANLAGADLSSGTDLSNANLNKADLSGANLSNANLSDANLNNVDLTDANLTGAITTGANFNMVTWSNTTCPDGTNSSASTPETCVGHL